MNRKKKLLKKFNDRNKKARAKLAPNKKKSTYISKAERARLAAEAEAADSTSNE